MCFLKFKWPLHRDTLSRNSTAVSCMEQCSLFSSTMGLDSEERIQCQAAAVKRHTGIPWHSLLHQIPFGICSWHTEPQTWREALVLHWHIRIAGATAGQNKLDELSACIRLFISFDVTYLSSKNIPKDSFRDTASIFIQPFCVLAYCLNKKLAMH